MLSIALFESLLVQVSEAAIDTLWLLCNYLVEHRNQLEKLRRHRIDFHGHCICKFLQVTISEVCLNLVKTASLPIDNFHVLGLHFSLHFHSRHVCSQLRIVSIFRHHCKVRVAEAVISDIVVISVRSSLLLLFCILALAPSRDFFGLFDLGQTILLGFFFNVIRVLSALNFLCCQASSRDFDLPGKHRVLRLLRI